MGRDSQSTGIVFFRSLLQGRATKVVVIQVYITNAYRADAIADSYPQRGIYVVLGGLHVTSLPGEAAIHADTISCLNVVELPQVSVIVKILPARLKFVLVRFLTITDTCWFMP